jgi:hypothetical protein
MRCIRLAGCCYTAEQHDLCFLRTTEHTDTAAKEIDIELENYNCLMLVFEGKNIETKKKAGDVLGVFDC